MRRATRFAAATCLAASAVLLAVPAGAAGEVQVSPIDARYFVEASVTEYTIQITAPAEVQQTLEIDWNSPGCGTASNPAPNILQWSHPHPPCDTGLHDTQLIRVVVTVEDLGVQITCRYLGAETGTGGDCIERALVGSPTATPSVTDEPTATESPTGAATDGVVPGPEAGSGLPIALFALGTLGVLAVVALVGIIAVRASRRREALLDPCAPRHRRGMEYLAAELVAFATQNRLAIGQALTPGALPATAVPDAAAILADLPEEATGGRRAAWSSALGTEDDLVRYARTPELLARSEAWFGAEGPWRAAAEVTALRIVRRTSDGYAQARSAGWEGGVGTIVEHLARSVGSPTLAAAIAANAFAAAAIAVSDALVRLNEASDAAGCPTVPLPEVKFFSLPAGDDRARVGAELLRHL
ncbi:MAG: hypothetical protein ACKO8G_00595, partial [Actinomycetota bacterium]